MNPETVALIGVVVGVAGIIFAALNWRREDTGKLVVQQAQIFEDMKGLNAELRLELERVRDRRDKLIQELEKTALELKADHVDRDALLTKCKQIDIDLVAATRRIVELEQELLEFLEKNGHG